MNTTIIPQDTSAEITTICEGNKVDSDEDGIPDYNDNCPDVCNPLQMDADMDGIGDLCDPDPGCGGCAQGHIGMTGKGEVMVSTGNRNFPGKQGDGRNYLVSPEVVAYSVLNGYISYGEGV